jgi:quercetin dioxygenase-like cupin family protein
MVALRIAAGMGNHWIGARTMLVKRAEEREWTGAGYEGAERAVLRMSPEQGRTNLVRLKKGARGPRHKHLAGEHVLVLTGKVAIAGETLAAGDYSFTEAGEEHDLVALEDSLMFVTSDKAIVVTG